MFRFVFAVLAITSLLIFHFRTPPQPEPTFGAAAFDAFSRDDDIFNTGNLSWTHTPSGTPRGVLCYFVGDEGIDDVSSVTYGGTSMTEVALSPITKGTGEIGAVHAFFLGSSVPTGAQTVSMTFRVGGTSSHSGGCFSLTGAADLEVEDTTTISQDTGADPSGTLTIDEDSSLFVAFMSGQGAVTGITPSTGWTSRGEMDWGAQVAGFYSKDTNVSSNTAFGWTATTDDALAIGVAIKEAAAAPSSSSFDDTSFEILN